MSIQIDLEKFEKIVRKNAFHGCLNCFLFLCSFILLNAILINVAESIEINEHWKWVILIPFGFLFGRWISDR